MMEAASNRKNDSKDLNDSHNVKVYELEVTVSELRESNARLQTDQEHAEKRCYQAIEELEHLRKSYERLETQFFNTETELNDISQKLERAHRAQASLEITLEEKSTTLEEEREVWEKRESELISELSSVKRKATVQRRQTITATTAPYSPNSLSRNRVSMHTRNKSGTISQSHLSFVHPVLHEKVDYLPSSLSVAVEQEQDTFDKEQEAQGQIQRLTKKLKKLEQQMEQNSNETVRAQYETEKTLKELSIARSNISKLENAIDQLNELNESLREDNESYQMLLHMGTIKGGFSIENSRSSFDSKKSDSVGNQSGAASTTISNKDNSSKCDNSISSNGKQEDNLLKDNDIQSSSGIDLASELDQVMSTCNEGARISRLEEKITGLKEELRTAKYERRHLSDENKALSLYINKILSRILASTDGLEAILSRDYDNSTTRLNSGSRSAVPISTSFTTPPRQISQHIRARSSVAPATKRRVAFGSNALPIEPFSQRGSGDGITSVFIPPSSPGIISNRNNNKALPIPPENQVNICTRDHSSEMQQKPTQTHTSFSGRTRSATHSAGMDMPSQENLPDNKCTPADSTAVSNTGTWWRRMSVRFGNGWTIHDGNSSVASIQQHQQH